MNDQPAIAVGIGDKIGALEQGVHRVPAGHMPVQLRCERPATASGVKRIFCPVCWATAFRESERAAPAAQKFAACAQRRTRRQYKDAIRHGKTLHGSPLYPGILLPRTVAVIGLPPSSITLAAAEFLSLQHPGVIAHQLNADHPPRGFRRARGAKASARNWCCHPHGIRR